MLDSNDKNKRMKSYAEFAKEFVHSEQVARKAEDQAQPWTCDECDRKVPKQGKQPDHFLCPHCIGEASDSNA